MSCRYTLVIHELNGSTRMQAFDGFNPVNAVEVPFNSGINYNVK